MDKPKFIAVLEINDALMATRLNPSVRLLNKQVWSTNHVHVRLRRERAVKQTTRAYYLAR